MPRRRPGSCSCSNSPLKVAGGCTRIPAFEVRPAGRRCVLAIENRCADTSCSGFKQAHGRSSGYRLHSIKHVQEGKGAVDDKDIHQMWGAQFLQTGRVLVVFLWDEVEQQGLPLLSVQAMRSIS